MAMALNMPALAALAILGVWGPTLTAIIVSGYMYGMDGIKDLLSRLKIWRIGAWWILVLIVPFALIFSVSVSAALTTGDVGYFSRLPPIYVALISLLMSTIFAGFGEEIGWRGFLLPRLQNRFTALHSSLILGIIWGLWHFPEFLMGGGGLHGALAAELGFFLALLYFTALITTFSIVLTWFVNNTKGSVLVPVLVHGFVNGWAGYFMAAGVPIFPFFHWYFVVSLTTAIIVIVLFKSENLSKDERITVSDD